MIKKINTVTVAVLLIAVLITGLAAFQTISRYSRESDQLYLQTAGKTIQQLILDGHEPEAAAIRTQTIFSQESIPVRVTIITGDGQVLYDNEADSATMDNHLFREEIALALRSRDSGFAIRRSDTLDLEMIYVARYIPDLDMVVRTSMQVYHSRQALNSMALTILLVMLITFAVLILLSSLVTRHLARPLKQLTVAAREMAVGQYSSRIHLLAQDNSEVAVLGAAFNRMAEQLEQTINDLADRNERLDVIFNTITDPLLVIGPSSSVTFMNRRARELFGRDLDPDKAVYPLVFITHNQASEDLVEEAIRDNRSVHAELRLNTVTGKATFQAIATPIRASNADSAMITLHDVTELDKVQQMRSEFVANVTHELKTPLTSIRGFVETLRAGAVQKPEVADRFLEFIDLEAERLHQLIHDILVLSEIERNQQEQNYQDFDLFTQVDAVLVLLDDAAANAQVALRADEPDAPLMVKADPDRIKQLLINLVDNAIKYNHPGGSVHIQAERQADDMVRIAVQDTGDGIAAEHLERVFERFYRIDKSRSRELGGTGLGLSIVKHIAQLYSGYAKVNSKPGVGSVFEVFLKI